MVDSAELFLLLIFIIATVFVITKGRSSFLLVRRVHFFKSYVKGIPPEIRDLALEEAVLLIESRRPFSPLSDQDIREFDKRHSNKEVASTADPTRDEVEAVDTTSNTAQPISTSKTS